MAENSINSPVTPDITRPDGGNSRRSSFAAAGSANSQEKTLSRYLRASSGSCHDFCKYGKKHESEEKARHPFLKRIIKKTCDEPNLFESLDLPQRKKTPASMSKSSPNSRTHTPDTSEVIKLLVSIDSPDRNNSRIHKVLPKKEKASVAKLKSKRSPNTRSHSHDTSDVIKLEVPTGSSDNKTSRKHEILLKEKKTSTAKLRSLPNLKSRFSDAPKFIPQDLSSYSESVGVSSKEVSSKAKEKSFSKWRTTSFKLKSQADASVPSEDLNVRRNNEISDTKMGKRTATSKVSVKKVLASSRASSSPRASVAGATSLTARKNRNLKVLPPLKDQNKVKKAETEQPFNEHDGGNNETLQEKTLYVIKMETESILLESDKNENCAAELSPLVASSPKSSSLPVSPPLSSYSGRDLDDSDYTVTEAEDDSDSEYDEDGTVNMEEAEILEGENGGRPRKAGMVFSNDKDCQPVKLSFRRGKVLDIQSEDNGPRMLKLRRGRVLGENQNVKAHRRTFRRRGGNGDTNDSKSVGEKVVLRHQDVQGKKDEKGLFNNVIEETASNLLKPEKVRLRPWLVRLKLSSPSKTPNLQQTLSLELG